MAWIRKGRGIGHLPEQRQSVVGRLSLSGVLPAAEQRPRGERRTDRDLGVGGFREIVLLRLRAESTKQERTAIGVGSHELREGLVEGIGGGLGIALCDR